MKELVVSGDPDLRLALENIRATEGEVRDTGLLAILSVVFALSGAFAQRVLEEISPERQVFGWLFATRSLALCEADVTAALASVETYVPHTTSDAEEAVFIPTKEDLRSFFLVLRACVRKDWPAARSAAQLITGCHFYLDALEMIAVWSYVSEDQAAYEAAHDRIMRAIEHGAKPSFYIGLTLTEKSTLKASKYLRDQRLKREERLQRFIKLNGPEVVIQAETRMVAEAGGLVLAQETMNRFGMNIGEYDLARAFACGCALNGDFVTARDYARLVTDPTDRGLAYLQIFRFKLEN